jgi:hypothetical protein
MADGTPSAAPAAAPAGQSGNTHVPGANPAPPGNVPGQKPGETPAQSEARRLKLRIDNQEVELDESEVVANYRKGKDSSKLLSKVEQRRQEALKAQAQAEGLFNRLKDKGNLRSTLAELGYSKDDIRRISEQTILEEIELEKMSPAERRAHELQQELDAHKSEKQKAEEEKKQAAFETEKARHQDEFANLFMETMERTGLPRSSGRFVVQRMAALYAQNEEAGLESSPEEMAAHVMRGLETEHRGVLSGLEGDALLERLGPDVVKRVLGAHLARVNKKRTGGVAEQASVARQKPIPAPAAPNPRKGRWAAIEGLIKGG